ncbi:MAG: hypothetical protein JWQ04_1937 [Pedosphaera sp.]|nr:hypothetical protein [Pedosphaera sp.]
MNNATNVFEWWGKAVEASIPFWRNWGIVSESQKEIMDNYRSGTSDEYQKFLQLVPTNLSQTINPWSFSLVQFTNQIKGNPVIERKIITEVAGYGSQLGTILDFLGVLEKVVKLEKAKLTDPKQIDAVAKFHDLVKQVNQVKQQAQ